jgi:hypothetical protein
LIYIVRPCQRERGERERDREREREREREVLVNHPWKIPILLLRIRTDSPFLKGGHIDQNSYKLRIWGLLSPISILRTLSPRNNQM